MNSQKKMNKLITFLFSLFISFSLFAQSNQVTLSGSMPEYAGRAVELYQTDPITGEKHVIASLQIGASGSFSKQIPLSSTTFCQADFDVWQAFIYLEPGKSYKLVFPPLKKISEAEQRNPFFQPEIVPFGIEDATANDLNRVILNFENEFSVKENHFFNKIYRDKSKAAVDSLKSAINAKFPNNGNGYFEEYKFYRLATVDFALHQGRTETFVKSCFVDHKFDLSLPPCNNLFNQLFTNYFSIRANSIGGEDFRKLVGQANLSGIENDLATENGWNSRLSHQVILKSINDAFYQGLFSPKSLLNLLDKISASNWTGAEKQTATDLKAKLTYLLQGTNAPGISFTGFDGKPHQLSEFKGQYIYLHFTSVANPICRQHLDYLKKVSTTFSSQLVILNIIPRSEEGKKDLIQQQEWPGQFFTVSNDEADKYRVKSFPTTYLIDPDGKLQLAPAFNPMDGFDRQFSAIMKQKRMEEFRNQAR